MPELPEVEVLRRSLEPLLVGERIGAVEVRCPALREPLDRKALEALAGATIEALSRRAKYLRLHLSGGRLLVVHLGMSGQLTVETTAPPALHEHVVFHLGSGRQLRFRDPRRFGQVFTVAAAAAPEHPRFRHLGWEPLPGDGDGGGLTGGILAAAAKGRRGPVKAFLMDATVVVGVGNIYASEALFRAGIHPSRSVARIARRRWDRLAAAVQEVLAAAIAEGGTTLNDFLDGERRGGYFQVSLAVYGRAGEPCPRCATAIRRAVHSGRGTYYCVRCQR